LKCHPTCKACKQQSGGWFSGNGARDEDDCTECAEDEPVALKDGRCECIEGATRDATDHKCYCDEPTGADAVDKMAFFESKPRKQCRVICKDGMREVYGDKQSMCLTNAAFKAVIRADFQKKAGGEGAQQGSCKDDENEYTDSDGVKTCISMAYVRDILKYY